MKILILFSHLWHGGRAGGAETHVSQLIQELARRGHEIVFVACKGKSGEEFLPSGASVQYRLPFRSINPADQIRVYTALASIVRRHGTEIIHAHHRTAGYFAELIFRRMQVPYVISVHDTWRRAPFKKWHGGFLRRLLAVSAYIKAEMEKQFGFPGANICVVHNGVDPAPFERPLREEAVAFRKKFGIDEDEIVVSLIARVTRAKGHYELIEALRLLPRSLRYKCLIVGEGKERPKLERLVSEHGLSDKAIFTGFEGNIPAVLQASDIMLLPSHFEPFGLAVVEAMLSHTAVIGSNSGAIPEIITHGKNGLLFKAQNPAELARCMEALIGDRGLRHRLGDEGYRTAQSRFLLTRMVDDTEAYYAEIVREAKKAGQKFGRP